MTATGTAGTWIRFSGTAAQLQSAFGVSLHNYSVNSVSGYANTNAPVIPSSLSSFVVGIAGLNTVAPGSSSKALTQATYAATGWLAATEFASLYDVTPLTSAGNTGSKEQIAVTGSEAVSPADIAAYRNAAGLAALTLSSSGTLPQTNSTGVATAELELAGGVAPGAQLIYYAAGSELDAAEIATDANASAVLLLSHIGCEAAYSSAEITAYQQMSQQAAAEGITVIAPAGDAGAAACDAGALYATQGLSVAFPASLPQVIAVGGTSLNGKTETAESAWNTLNDAAYPAPLVLAGGGGSSSLFAKPTWQASTTSDSVRDVPDISLVADQMYPVCVGGSCSNGFANTSGTAYAMQGTTAASASFAGVVALLAQQAGGTSGRLGNFAPLLYSISSSNAAALHDVTSGSNAVPCSANCPTANQIGYTAATGYDLATGLGSVDANVIALAIPRPLAAVTTTTGLTFDNYTVTYGTAVTATATVTPATATGTVTFVDNAAGTLGAVNLNGSGQAVFILPTTLNSGAHEIEAEYGGDTNDLASNGYAGFTINPATTTTATSFSPISPVTQGTQETIIATVSPAAATGTVVFTDSIAGNLGSATLSGGVASIATSTLVPGNHDVTATYQGVTNYSTSNSSAVLTVAQKSTTTSVALTSSTISYGSSVTITATVSPATVSGSVTFTDSLGTALGTVTLVNGVATYTTTGFNIGSHTVTATYNGDTNDATSSGTAGLIVGQRTTTTTVSLSSASITYGTAVIITATINDSSATGTVTFTDSLGGTLGTGTVAGGVATFTATNLSSGSHSITANYSGSATDTSSTGTTTLTVAKATSTTAVQLSTISIAYGSNVTITVSVTPAAGTGTVTLTDSVAGTLGTVTLSGGVGQLNISTLAAGTHTITATYSGDANTSSSSGTASLTITPKTLTVTVTATPSVAVYGTLVTVSAAVSNTSATGTITFTDSVNGALGTITVSAGTATITTSALTVGAHTITAAYSGDTNNNAATGTAAVTILKGTSITTLTVTPSPSVVNFPSTLTATITNASTGTGTYAFTGTVSFYTGTTLLGSATVVNNQAVLSYTFTSIGNYSVYAVYSGDTNWNGSTSSIVTLLVEGVPTIVTLTTTTPTILAGANVILTSTVNATAAYSALVTTFPTGEVTFYDSYNGSFTTLGSASLIQSGLYSASTTFQSKFFLPGIHQITAVYNGNSLYSSGTATVFNITVQDFTLSASPATGVVLQGSTLTAGITVSSLYGFSGTVNFACTPPGGTYTSCTLTNSSVVGSGLTTLVMATDVAQDKSGTGLATSGVGEESRNQKKSKPGIAPENNSGGSSGGGPIGTALGALSLALLMGLVRPRRWKYGRLLMVLLAVTVLGCASLGFMGCTQISNKTGSVTGTTNTTPLGTQTFTVVATGTNGVTSVSHTLSYQVAVE